MLRRLKRYITRQLSPDRAFLLRVYNLTGIPPGNAHFYRVAFRHSSMLHSQGTDLGQESNERLEFLGDAVLGTVVSDYLYRHYPNRDEGWLTEMRAKIVRRKSLNALGQKLGLEELLEYNRKHSGFHPSMLGNTLEALVGAIYLDAGIEAAERFVLKRLLGVHIDLEALEITNENYKSQLMEFVQKMKMEPVSYEVLDEAQDADKRIFKVAVKIGDQVMGHGEDIRKKAAEQQACYEALIKLNLIDVSNGH